MAHNCFPPFLIYDIAILLCNFSSEVADRYQLHLITFKLFFHLIIFCLPSKIAEKSKTIKKNHFIFNFNPIKRVIMSWEIIKSAWKSFSIAETIHFIQSTRNSDSHSWRCDVFLSATYGNSFKYWNEARDHNKFEFFLSFNNFQLFFLPTTHSYDIREEWD